MSEITAPHGSSAGRSGRALVSSEFLGRLGYAFATIGLFAGWLVRDRHVLSAEYGLGYWLGIIGASLMALLLLYPLRKRSKWFRGLGPVSIWFRVHMVFGVLGPALIVFHCNFSLGSLNSQVALYCTLIVAGSGLIGRYIYARIHHGLYGQRATLFELRDAFTSLDDQLAPISRVAPKLIETLHDAEDSIQRGHVGVLGAIARALRASVVTRTVGYRLRRQIPQVLDELAGSSRVYAEQRPRLERNWLSLLDRRLEALRRYAQFVCFERSFALWHVVHYPVFIVMVAAVILHIFAVHMY
jgi:hypothetical protein